MQRHLRPALWKVDFHFRNIWSLPMLVLCNLRPEVEFILCLILSVSERNNMREASECALSIPAAYCIIFIFHLPVVLLAVPVWNSVRHPVRSNGEVRRGRRNLRERLCLNLFPGCCGSTAVPVRFCMLVVRPRVLGGAPVRQRLRVHNIHKIHQRIPVLFSMRLWVLSNWNRNGLRYLLCLAERLLHQFYILCLR